MAPCTTREDERHTSPGGSRCGPMTRLALLAKITLFVFVLRCLRLQAAPTDPRTRRIRLLQRTGLDRAHSLSLFAVFGRCDCQRFERLRSLD